MATYAWVSSFLQTLTTKYELEKPFVDDIQRMLLAAYNAHSPSSEEIDFQTTVSEKLNSILEKLSVASAPAPVSAPTASSSSSPPSASDSAPSEVSEQEEPKVEEKPAPKKRGRKKKDPSTPSKVSAYQLFVKEYRQEHNVGMKEAGNKWTEVKKEDPSLVEKYQTMADEINQKRLDEAAASAANQETN